MRIALITVAVIAIVPCVLLSGCGQKGPLFMPDDNPAPNSLTTSQPPSISQ